jgi:hypothetical protein
MLQLANVFMCGIGQMSPGAYLLQRDLFPSIVEVGASGQASLSQIDCMVYEVHQVL